jgi:cysteine desulfurase/selenocysteine lyase
MEAVINDTRATGVRQGLNIEKIRASFPMLSATVNGKPLIYFDSAATTHKPAVVLEALRRFYGEAYGKPQEAHHFAKKATEALEQTRKKIANFLGAPSEKEIIFTRGCTEAINLVSDGFAKSMLKKDDEIVITEMEHHANIVPWQMACDLSGARLRVLPITTSGEIDLDTFQEFLTDRTRIVSISHSSHVLGTILPVEEMIRLAHMKDIPVLLDGAQAAPHMPVNIKKLDCDFYTIAAHKMGAPSGVGILYGKKKWLQKLPPALGGGDMVKKVSFEKSEYQDIPMKFEAGTPPFGEIISMSALIDYLEELDMEKTSGYEQELLAYGTQRLSAISGLKIYGTAPEKEPVLSFELEGKDVKKLEKFLDEEYNIATRAGDLSAQPLMKILGVKGLLRISFCYYNTRQEIDILAEAIEAFNDR